MPHKDKYRSFEELRRYEKAGAFKITTRAGATETLIMAPHGGAIEPHTSKIARAIAGDDHGLYLFEGKKKACNYATLHLTSTRFDEPECLRMLATSTTVVAVHGCGRRSEEAVYLGGLDYELRAAFTVALEAAGYDARQSGHPWPATSPRNVCNLGKGGAGVQLELSSSLRNEMDIGAFAGVLRGILEEARTS